MSAGWYTSTDGEIRGPFDASTIRLMAASGDLKPTDHLRRGEVGEWVAAANTKGLEFGSPPVPVSPPTVRRVVAELAPDPPPWVPPGQSPQYVYKMVQIPRNVEIKEGMSQRGRAAGYLESVVNEHARTPISQMTFSFRHGMCAGTLGFPAFPTIPAEMTEGPNG